MKKILLVLLLAACGQSSATVVVPQSERDVPAGAVVSQDGQPVSNATVALLDGTDGPPVWVGTTDSAGHFDGPKNRSGELAISVTSKDHQSLFIKPTMLRREQLKFILEPIQQDDREIEIRVEYPHEKPTARTYARLTYVGAHRSEYYFAAFNEHNRVRLVVPARSMVARLESPTHQSQWEPILEGQSNDVLLTGFAKQTIMSATDEAVVAGLKRASKPTVNRNIPPTIVDSLSASRMIGLGEATHGTSEFVEWKSNLVKALAKKNQLSVLAMEANFAESLVIDKILQTGEGNLASALAGLHFWIWDVEEILDLLGWLRDRNRTLPAAIRTRFVGIDAQFTHVATRLLLAKVEKLAPSSHAETSAMLGPLLEEDIGALFLLDLETRTSLIANLTKLRIRLNGIGNPKVIDLERDQLVETLIQALRYSGGGFIQRSNLRDKHLAENALWSLQHYARRGTVIVWSHNSHVGRGRVPFVKPMGMWLHEHLRSRYSAVGFFFNEGQFRVRDSKKKAGGVEVMQVPPSPKNFVEAGFALAGDEFVLEIGALSEPALTWLGARRTREAGAVFSDDVEHMISQIGSLYDFIGFVRTSTPTHPTPTGVRKPGE